MVLLVDGLFKQPIDDSGYRYLEKGQEHVTARVIASGDVTGTQHSATRFRNRARPNVFDVPAPPLIAKRKGDDGGRGIPHSILSPGPYSRRRRPMMKHVDIVTILEYLHCSFLLSRSLYSCLFFSLSHAHTCDISVLSNAAVKLT